MLMSGTLNAHLEEVDQASEKMMDRLMTQMAEREGITEAMKAENQMKWVQAMNCIYHCATEIVARDMMCC